MIALIEFCYICFESIIANLEKSRNFQIYRYFSRRSNQRDQYPLFVTWKKNNQLRGCIGTFQHNPIYMGLKKYSRSAAFEDSRFPPITKEEVPSLSCTVSILHDFEDASDAYDWTVGKHGIILTIKNIYSATFLPEVMTENHWSKDETLKQLAIKSGYKGNIDKAFLKSSCKVRRYQTSSITATYEQYIEYAKQFERNNEL